MSKQITMRRSAVYLGATLAAGSTYEVDDATADALVAAKSAIFGPVYAEASTAILLARARSSGNPTIQFWSSDLGAKSLQVLLTGLAASDLVVAGWSSNSNDGVTVGALIDAVCDDIEASVPLVTQAVNVRVLPAANVWVPFLWDEVSRIKTFGLVVSRLGAATGATAQKAVCEISF